MAASLLVRAAAGGATRNVSTSRRVRDVYRRRTPQRSRWLRAAIRFRAVWRREGTYEHGTVLIENNPEETLRGLSSAPIFGYHATSKSRVLEQVKKGRFDSRNAPIFFVSRDAILQALNFGGQDKDAVLLVCASDDQDSDQGLSNQGVFPPGADVRILRMEEIPESEKAKNPVDLIARGEKAWQEAVKEFERNEIV